MREVIAVCRSSKRSRVRVAAVLDRYLWRIGDRTWRGRASNACLDRVARELRDNAKRNTAVVIHEIRSARESRVPIVRIGSRTAFSPEGVVPVIVRANSTGRQARSEGERARLALVQIAVLFHDLGKATELFQSKLRRGLKRGAKPEADAVRHELFSAVAWDELVGELSDGDLIQRLGSLTSGDIDEACNGAIDRLWSFHAHPEKPMQFAFAERNGRPHEREGTIAHAVGMLVLTHHRLPEGSGNHLRLQTEQHVKSDNQLNVEELKIARGGKPFWHDEKWILRLHRAAGRLKSGGGAAGLDIALRATLMFADHLGSALKVACDKVPGHLGNTKDGKPADTLDMHIERVWQRVLGCYDMLHRHRERYPALGEDEVPLDIRHPEVAPEPFAWQAATAQAARQLCEAREGGFFACLMAGTGTGKTRGAPTVLAAAAFSDVRPERRYLRMTLALGLRSLATQSAQEYVENLGFDRDAVSVLIGQPPVRFDDFDDATDSGDGSQSLIALPDWLRIERAIGGVPDEGAEREADWLRRLSFDTDRGLPATLDLVIENASKGSGTARLLASAPIIVGTVDHLMGVAAPINSRFLLQSVRVLTADLILDEIDQYEPEDIAAVARLVYQSAAGGRRVIIMSATLTGDVAAALFEAYRQGWGEYATSSGMSGEVNALCAGDAADSCTTNRSGCTFEQVYDACRTATLAALAARQPQRRGLVLPPSGSWADLVEQVSAQCTALHATTAQSIAGTKVSFGFVRMTRISHTAALAAQLPAGPLDGRLRLKLCLHSQFPRLHRAWIERELKQALTRKGRDPNEQLRAFCERHGLFQRVRAAGCTELSIVVVTSPAIETGNDLDFDWAILDPSSMRAVVQASGRVWRHRTYKGNTPNVAVLGRSPIVMQTGKLARPGVETRSHPSTGVPSVDLDEFGARYFSDLAGDWKFELIDARAILDDSRAPLREKEAVLRRKMLATSGECAPLGDYLRHSTARLNRRMTDSRVFRRNTTRDLCYFRGSEDEWMLDLAPGTRNSQPVKAEGRGLSLCLRKDPHLVFSMLDDLAWADQLRHEEIPSAYKIQSLTEIRVPEYGDPSNQPEPIITYWEWTGFTRGRPEDLFQPFGKML